MCEVQSAKSLGLAYQLCRSLHWKNHQLVARLVRDSLALLGCVTPSEVTLAMLFMKLHANNFMHTKNK